MKYFISDNHWGHNAIIRLSNRPFKNLHEMDTKMIDSWNSVVGKDDEVYFLGDLSYKVNPNYLNQILSKLNGKIYLIKGNHDKSKFIEKSLNRFEWIKEYYTFDYVYENIPYKFVLFHYPIYEWDGMWRGSIHVCGHVHINSTEYFDNHQGKIINVSCELLDYKPISIVEVIEKMKLKVLTPPQRKNIEK